MRSAHLRASLLDRLVDADPEAKSEKVSLRTQRAPALRHAVQRDLQHLFSTRRAIPTEGGRMVHHFGVPDFIHLNPRSESDRAVMAAALKEAIETWEPRLQQVQVEVHASEEAVPKLLQAIRTDGTGALWSQLTQPNGEIRDNLRGLLPIEAVVIRVKGMLQAEGLQEPVSFPFVVRR